MRSRPEPMATGFREHAPDERRANSLCSVNATPAGGEFPARRRRRNERRPMTGPGSAIGRIAARMRQADAPPSVVWTGPP